MECPGCGSFSSRVLQEYCKENPCPSCGLSPQATAAIASLRQESDLARLRESAVQVVLRADRASRKAAALQRRLERILEICNDQP